MTTHEWVERNLDRKQDVVLITGASSGIGREFLTAFAAMGCRCVATSNDAAELAAACGEVRSRHAVEVTEVVADLSTTDGQQTLLREVAVYRVGVLVNNAGFGLKGAFTDHDPQRYADLVMLNALAPTLLCRAVLPGMTAAGRGLVIHVASVNACTPIAYNAVYTATKAYLLYYAYAVRHELRGSPVVFQIVLPGTTNTPFHARQGAVPQAMVMGPELVVRRSLARIDRALSISNRIDRWLFPLVARLPLPLRVRLATYLLKKRLKQTAA